MSRFTYILLMILIVAIVITNPATAMAAASDIEISQSYIDKGIITVSSNTNSNSKAIIRITKDKTNYDYSLVEGAQYPLQMGNGIYKVTVAELVSGNKYKAVSQKELNLKLKDNNEVFLQAIQLIDWNDESKAVLKAKELVKNIKSEKKKIEVIYSYIIENFKYDHDKAKVVKTGYIPDLDGVFEASKGICYDYAAVLAAMLRSVGVPTKLVMGYNENSPKTYHAWNQVFLPELNEWITIDTTYDSIVLQNGKTANMIKNQNEYKVSKQY